MGSCFYFPEGASPLNAGVNPEVLASRKVVYREVCTEGSETTDEQNQAKRIMNTFENK